MAEVVPSWHPSIFHSKQKAVFAVAGRFGADELLLAIRTFFHIACCGLPSLPSTSIAELTSQLCY
jgi:hypothetical protein